MCASPMLRGPFPKNPVGMSCPKNPGLGPLHSYSFRMGLEPEKSYSRDGSGFLGNGPFEDVFPFENGDVPLTCLFYGV